MNLGRIIKRFFIYQEPVDREIFELLEEDDEGQPDSGPSKAESDFPQPDAKSSLGARLVRFLSRTPQQTEIQKEEDGKISPNLSKTLARIKREFHLPTNQDVIIREFEIWGTTKAFLVYLEGMVEQKTINDNILRPLLQIRDMKGKSTANVVDYLLTNVLTVDEATVVTEYSPIIKSILGGKTALFVAGGSGGIVIESTHFEKRAVSTPRREATIQGPQEAFVEDLHTNISLVRKILRNKNLITETVEVGTESHVTCAVMYMKNIANDRIVQEVLRRIKSLSVDFICAGSLRQLIEDYPNGLLPQILNTERPDRAASLLLEGRVTIIVDGTPSANTVPVSLLDFLHTVEDFTVRWPYGTFLRTVRLIAALFAVFLPGAYLALVMYHHEAIPTGLLTTITVARENVPFPQVLELFLMEVAWELVREAGLRVPGTIGQTLGIVGGVILGQAAVAAGLVSPIFIIVVAITGLGNFAIPNVSLGFGARILRFIFLFFGAVAGFYGISVAFVLFGAMVCSMKSFGVPYFSPIGPKTFEAQIIPIQPPWEHTRRPDSIDPKKRWKTKKPMRGWMEKEEE